MSIHHKVIYIHVVAAAVHKCFCIYNHHKKIYHKIAKFVLSQNKLCLQYYDLCFFHYKVP